MKGRPEERGRKERGKEGVKEEARRGERKEGN